MITKILEGVEVTLGNGNTVEVLPPCEDKTSGHWYCTTHKKAFLNQWEKDSHIHRGKHTLGWFCLRHGLETP